MRIEKLEIHPITMTLRSPIPMSNGVIESTGNVLVKLVTDEGATGWGEGVEAPSLTHQRQADIVSDLEMLTRLVIGTDPMRRNEVWGRLTQAHPSAATAIGAIDIALHDLGGKVLGVPASQLLGGAVRDRIPALTLVGSGDPSIDAEKLASRHEQGFNWFKIKLGMAAPEAELATLAKAAELVGEAGVVCGDVNEAWSEDEARSFLDQVDPDRVRFIEQPVARSDRDALIRLAESVPVKLCADESAGSLQAVVGFAGTPVGGVSLKLIKHGGMTGVMRGAAICSAGGLGINLAGKVIESSVSAAANLHCAAAMNAVDFGCSPANQGVVQDVTESPISVTNGYFDIPTAPGLGIEVDEGMVRRL
ncbi:MAG: mandelate racemase/muconate lactonizing enzyme family protein [Acidimicrobiia bacterium]